ncbi:MAG: SO_0444 family Cu/Zn efflux transporter [Gammaproteobacteria bacterium]|nr:SO_0444 family Cu/Zn efflux transporter [Gammaproteobacteria bacterium]
MAFFLENTLQLALESAPWLLLGLIAAGLIRAWVPLDLVGRSLGGSGWSPVTRAALIGAPLPLCSCGVLPAAMALRRSGASRASTTAFLISTPETGVDSVALSWVLLGPFMAILRPVSAIVSAVAAGMLVGWTQVRELSKSLSVPVAIGVAGGECAAGSACCSEATPGNEGDRQAGLWVRTWDGLKYAFSDLIDDLAIWLAVGILAAGAVITLVPPGMLSSWGSGLGAMLLVMLFSIPMYVCATASTPLAHAMLFAGVSPGTVLVFLLAGPASNIASLALVRRELGNRALVAYLGGVGGMSILLGLGLDALIDSASLDLISQMNSGGGGEHESPVVIGVLSLLVILVVAIRPFRRYLVKGKVDEEGSCCG